MIPALFAAAIVLPYIGLRALLANSPVIPDNRQPSEAMLHWQKQRQAQRRLAGMVRGNQRAVELDWRRRSVAAKKGASRV